jgi:hypothetical protein
MLMNADVGRRTVGGGGARPENTNFDETRAGFNARHSRSGRLTNIMGDILMVRQVVAHG